jgi:hypothetical protein
MFIDNAMESAKAACLRYLTEDHGTLEAEKKAIVPVIDATKKVLASAGFAMAVKRFALDIYRGHRNADGGLNMRQVTRITLLSDGKLVKEDLITSLDGEQLLGRQVYAVEIGAVLDSGIPAKALVSSIQQFLDDPNYTALAKGAKN